MMKNQVVFVPTAAPMGSLTAPAPKKPELLLQCVFTEFLIRIYPSPQGS